MRTVALVLAALAVLSACTGSSSSRYYDFDGDQSAPALIAIADRKPAEDFGGSLLSGKGDYDLSSTDRGKIVVVNFWGSWCPPCLVETPAFQAIYQAYRNKGVAFVGIVVKDDTRSKPASFVAEKHITYPNVYDEKGEVGIRLGNIPSQTTPHTILLDTRHRVAAVYLQPLTAGDLDPALDALLAES